MKFWKIASISVITILILAMGTAVILAQEVDDAPPFVPGPGFVDENGDGLCDVGGQVPGSGIANSYGRGQMWNQDGFNGRMGQAGMGGFMGLMAEDMTGNRLYDTAADILGISVDEVWAEMNNGVSLADLAASYGVDVQTILDAHLADHEALVAQAVADGSMTQEQADWMLANMSSRATEMVNQPHTPLSGNRMMGGMGGAGRGQMGGGMGHGQRGSANFAPQGNGA